MNTASELDVIAHKLSTARDTLLADSQSLGKLYDQNQAIFNELQQWISVGHVKLDELDAQLAAANAAQPTNKQELDDLTSLRDQVDKHVHDLELTAMVRLQNAPKIRIVQQGDVVMAEKLNSSVLNTVPLWKDNLALAITQQRQKAAIALENRVDDATNPMLRQSADMLHDNSVAIAKSSARSIVDLDTLQHTQDQLLATISDVATITKDAAAARDTARQELNKMVTQLRA